MFVDFFLKFMNSCCCTILIHIKKYIQCIHIQLCYGRCHARHFAFLYMSRQKHFPGSPAHQTWWNCHFISSIFSWERVAGRGSLWLHTPYLSLGTEKRASKAEELVVCWCCLQCFVQKKKRCILSFPNPILVLWQGIYPLSWCSVTLGCTTLLTVKVVT